MATRLWTIGPNGAVEDVIEGVGAAASSVYPINLTVDLATTTVTEGGSTRAVNRSEVLNAIKALEQYILNKNWPPA